MLVPVQARRPDGNLHKRKSIFYWRKYTDVP